MMPLLVRTILVVVVASSLVRCLGETTVGGVGLRGGIGTTTTTTTTTTAIAISTDPVGASTDFPPYDCALEMVALSASIYRYRGLNSCYDVTPAPVLPPGVVCHLYERDRQDTQCVVVSNPRVGYAAVVYAGTDDFRNALTDADVVIKPFGPRSSNGTYPLMPGQYPRARVHAGFDNAVFRDGLFERVLTAVRGALGEGGNYRVMTTGHSLGAADSLLAAVALRRSLPDRAVLNLNFGCPRTGNVHWREYVNSIDGLAVWRFVNGVDIVPRLPNLIFKHAGHTVQMGITGARAYYLHFGDEGLGYKGVPVGWGTVPFVIVPFNGAAHLVQRYAHYIRDRAGADPDTYYVHDFVRVRDDDHDNDNDNDSDDDGGNRIFGDDDVFPGPPDGWYEEYYEED